MSKPNNLWRITGEADEAGEHWIASHAARVGRKYEEQAQKTRERLREEDSREPEDNQE